MEPIIEHIQGCQLKCLENEQVCGRPPFAPDSCACRALLQHEACWSILTSQQYAADLAVFFMVLMLSWQYTRPVTGCAAAGADAQGARPPG